jgi:hypothetical protein
MGLFQNLPSEIVRIILEYDGKIAYRTGKYIDRIPKNDKRYRLIRKIPKPIFVCMDRTIPLVILRLAPMRDDRRSGRIEDGMGRVSPLDTSKKSEIHFILLKKPIDKSLFDENGIQNSNIFASGLSPSANFGLPTDVPSSGIPRNENSNQNKNAILYMFEKYISSYEQAYEFRRIFM